MKPRECPEQKLRQLAVWLKERHESWEKLYERGGFAPEPDGIRLNELRGQIMRLRRDILLLCEQSGLDYPDIAYESAPPLLSDSFRVEPVTPHRLVYECVADRNKPKQLSLF